MIFLLAAVLMEAVGLLLEAFFYMHREEKREAAWSIERQRLINLAISNGRPQEFVALQRASQIAAAVPAPEKEHPFARRPVAEALADRVVARPQQLDI